MPRFFISIIVLITILWGAFIILLLKTAPISLPNILLFLGILFLAVGLTVSMPVFYYFRSQRRLAFAMPNETYRIGLRWSLYFSFGFVGFLMLKAFDILNILNGGLFLVLYILLYFYLKQR